MAMVNSAEDRLWELGGGLGGGQSRKIGTSAIAQTIKYLKDKKNQTQSEGEGSYLFVYFSLLFIFYWIYWGDIG